MVLRNFKILQSDLETAPIFPNSPLVSFKRDRNLRNSLVRSSLPSNLEPGTFNCSRKVCNTCPFINSKTHIQGAKGLYQVNDHFDCTTSNIIYCITCTLCNKLYIGESGRKLGDRFREHLLDVKNEGSDLSKPVTRHFNLPGHLHEHMEICGIYLHFGNTEWNLKKERTERLCSHLVTEDLCLGTGTKRCCVHTRSFQNIDTIKVPEYKVKTLYSGTGAVPEFWHGYLKKRCVHIRPQR